MSSEYLAGDGIDQCGDFHLIPKDILDKGWIVAFILAVFSQSINPLLDFGDPTAASPTSHNTCLFLSGL